MIRVCASLTTVMTLSWGGLPLPQAHAGKVSYTTCSKFARQVLQPALRKGATRSTMMRAMKALKRNGKKGFGIVTLAELQAAKGLLAAASAGCAAANYRPLQAKGASCPGQGWPLGDPVQWCQQAADQATIMEQMAQEVIAAKVKSMTRRPHPKSGWIYDDFVSYEDATSLSPSRQAAFEAEVGTILRTATGSVDKAKVAAAVELAVAEYKVAKTAIDQGIGIRRTIRVDKHKSGKVAFKAVKSRYGKKVKLKSSGRLGRWQMRGKRMREVRSGRVAFVPSRRSAKGFVTYQVPGEPMCQTRAYEFTEKAKSKRPNTKFKTVQAEDIKWLGLRYEACKGKGIGPAGLGPGGSGRQAL